MPLPLSPTKGGNTPVKDSLKKIGTAIAAAFTSPEAVKAEKSLAALVITRLLITLGASAAIVDIVVKALS